MSTTIYAHTHTYIHVHIERIHTEAPLIGEGSIVCCVCIVSFPQPITECTLCYWKSGLPDVCICCWIEQYASSVLQKKRKKPRVCI